MWTFLSSLARHQAFDFYLNDLFKGNCWARASHKYCFIGSGPRPPNPHKTHITRNTTPHPLHTASLQACQYGVVLSPYRAKEGQTATRAAGAQPVRELCCQASNNIWRQPWFKVTFKVYLSIANTHIQMNCIQKAIQGFSKAVFLFSSSSYVGVNSKVICQFI